MNTFSVPNISIFLLVFSDYGGGVFVPDVGLTTTNLLFVSITDLGIATPQQLVDKLAEVGRLD